MAPLIQIVLLSLLLNIPLVWQKDLYGQNLYPNPVQHPNNHGQLTGKSKTTLSIAIPHLKQYGSDTGTAEMVRETLITDLRTSGLADILHESAYIEDSQVSGTSFGTFDFRNWTSIGADFLVKGGLSLNGDQLIVELRLYDVSVRREVVGKRYTTPVTERSVFGRIGHKFADEMLFHLTGARGRFEYCSDNPAICRQSKASNQETGGIVAVPDTKSERGVQTTDKPIKPKSERTVSGQQKLSATSAKDCLTFENDRERLQCFDATAKRDASSPPAEAKLSTPKADQKQLAGEAIRSLRKIESATNVGISLREYQSRLIDMAGMVDESLRSMPNSQLKIKLLRAKQVYIDAAEMWSAMIRGRYISIFQDSYGAKLRAYEVEIPRISPDSSAKTSGAYQALVLSQLWKKAKVYLDEADKSLETPDH